MWGSKIWHLLCQQAAPGGAPVSVPRCVLLHLNSPGRVRAGVPCVTLAGGCHAHNVGVSLLSAVGLTEQWVAASEDEYVALALRAASDLEASPPRPGLRA